MTAFTRHSVLRRTNTSVQLDSVVQLREPTHRKWKADINNSDNQKFNRPSLRGRNVKEWRKCFKPADIREICCFINCAIIE